LSFLFFTEEKLTEVGIRLFIQRNYFIFDRKTIFMYKKIVYNSFGEEKYY